MIEPTRRALAPLHLRRRRVEVSQRQCVGDGKPALRQPFLIVTETNLALGVSPQVANESLIIPDVKAFQVKHGFLHLAVMAAWMQGSCGVG